MHKVDFTDNVTNYNAIFQHVIVNGGVLELVVGSTGHYLNVIVPKGTTENA